MTFAHPWLLLLLLLLPAFAWLKGKRGHPPAFLYSSVQLVRAVLNVSRSRSGGFLAALRWLALAAFIIALAQPRFTKSQTQVKASGIDIAVAMDLSGSMASEDFEVSGGRVSRIEMAKSVLKKFIEKRPNDRIGLIAFATEAYIAAPLTLDHDFLLHNLDRLELDVIDGSHTAIGSGLGTAINRLRSSGLRITQPRIAILETMLRFGQPASIEQIHGDLADSSCDLVTVTVRPRSLGCGMNWARPKSRIFSRPSRVRRRFPGFRSRCTIPCWCAAARP